jgi:hypothetical protein
MTNIRDSLNSLADAIEAVANQPAPKPQINDRELSGNKINGGRITNFSSVGIKDEANNFVLTVSNDGIHVDTAHVNTIPNSLAVNGSLNVDGEIFARKLHVDEISADIRNERTSPLEFKADSGVAYGKGLLWTGGDYTKQFVLQSNSDRFWSSEDIDLNRGKSYKIGNETVLSLNSLGTGVVHSNLQRVGVLEDLSVSGNLDIDNFIIYSADTQTLAIGAEESHGVLTLGNWDHSFIVDSTDAGHWKIGSWTTADLHIVTDNTARISINASGNVVVHTKTSFSNKVGIGVKNFAEDADLTVAGPIRMQGKKQEVADQIPTSGSYAKGDIVWNSDPRPTGYVGWICTREGTPGIWKPFGQIGS